jgi:tetratricopeptide (TPR) repeat protein
VRLLLISAFVFLASHISAQQDYFYAENLIDNGQYAEAVRVLDHLIDSGAYADRPRFAMMTLNLAGTTRLYLKDTAAAQKCFEAAMQCYDTLSIPRRSDDWNHREYYKAGEHLATVHYARKEYGAANRLLLQIGAPEQYYSATGSDILTAQTAYYSLRTRVFEKLDQPDSALASIRRIRDSEYHAPRMLDSIFNIETNVIRCVKLVPFTLIPADTRGTGAGSLYFASWKDKDNTPHSIWFVNYERGGLSILGQSSSGQKDAPHFPASCNAMSLSQNEQFLAVECSSEGTTWIDIISFPELLSQRECIVKHSITPYPGMASIESWENNLLCVKSDADLTKLNKKSRLSMPDVFGTVDDRQKFLFDPLSGKYTRK